MTNNVIKIRKFDTAQQVLEDAMARGLKHVVISGITEDGDNYYQATNRSTLLEIVWMTFCMQDTVRRMVNGDPPK